MRSESDTAPALRANFELDLPEFRLMPQFELGPELAVLFGPSGSGKSLTLRSLAGLQRPSRGRIELNRRPLFDHRRKIDLPPQARRIGYVPQHYALFPHRTIAENVAYGLHGWSPAERERQVQELLDLMRLEPLAERKPGEVSGGQQQRAALARALARQPDLLLMDEPFASVEAELRTHLRGELLRVQAEFAIPVLLVTHDLVDATALAQVLIVLDAGRVAQSGSRDQVFRHPATESVARLMGMTNILEVEYQGARGGQMAVEWNGTELLIDGPAAQQPPSRMTLGVRPEEIQLLQAPAPAETPNLLRGMIVGEALRGADHLIEVELPAGQLEVRVSHLDFTRMKLSLGERCEATVRPSSFHVFPVRSA